jgi:Flp pilus assembly protein TadD
VGAAGARELSALALAWPARGPLALAGATPEQKRELTSARAQTAWRAARRWPGEETLWTLACDASLAECDATPGAAGVTTALIAEGAARRALALVPTRAVNIERLANALGTRALRAGSVSLADSAEALFARADAMAPADGWLLVAHIRFLLERRDGPRALAAAQRLAALYPDAALGHSLTGAALLLLGRDGEARDALKRAETARWEEDAGEQRAALERLLHQLEPGAAPVAPRP